MSVNASKPKRFAHQYDQSDFKLMSRESCHSGFFSLDKVGLKHRRFDGDWSGEITREIFIRGNATAVLPYDPVKDNVVLVEQFRPGVILEAQSPWLLELIAGMNDEGEMPEEVARREAHEEAGIRLGEIEKICEYFVSPGGTTEKVFLYCSKINSDNVGGIHGLQDENEDIKVHVISVNEALELIQTGVINNASTIIGLQWLSMNKERLKDLWKEA